jgi:large subunit ribosomal protein L11
MGIEKASGKNVASPTGTISKALVREIAEEKMQDLSANDVEQAMKIIEGTCRSMGVKVV